MHKGFKCLDVSIGRIYIFRDVIIDESIFPFAKLHPNAGVRLRSKILLLPPSLIPPESLHNDVNNLGEPATNFPHPVNTNGGSSTRVQVADFSSTDTHDNTERPLAPVQTTAAAPPVAAINEDTVSISCAPARLSSGAEQGGASPARGSGHHSLGSDLGTVSPPRALVQQGPDADPINSEQIALVLLALLCQRPLHCRLLALVGGICLMLHLLLSNPQFNRLAHNSMKESVNLVCTSMAQFDMVWSLQLVNPPL
jgi:hypothetical protein